MSTALVLALVVSAGAAPAPAPSSAPPTAADDGPTADELKLLKQSILPGEWASVQKAVGDIAKLPLYRVQATAEIDSATFSGDVQLRYPVAKELSELPLRAFANAPYVSHGAPAVSMENLTCPGQTCAVTQPGDATLFVVKFTPPVPAGGVARLNFSFHGALPQIDPNKLTAQAQMASQAAMLSTHGGTPSDHGAFGSAEGVLSLTGMFPQVAQRTLPDGFDTGAPTGIGDASSFDVANYLFTLRSEPGATVVAGGSKLGEAPQPDGHMQATYAAAAVRDMPVYVSKRLVATTEQAGPVKVTAYTLPGDEASGKKVLDVTVRSMKEYSRRFGAYPWKELRVVEQPLTDGAAGIEHPTVISVGTLMYRTGAAMGPLAALATPQAKLGSHDANLGLTDKVLEYSVAAVVAHQWWGELVGSDERLDPASDEPLASYSAVLYLESRRGKEAAQDALDSQIAIGYQMMRQAGEPDGSVDQPVGAFSSALQFAGLVFGKAPLFYRAARKALGDATFGKVLARYEAKNRFTTLGPDAFVSAVHDVAPKQATAMSALRDHWFVEMHGDQDVGKLDYGKMLESSTGMQMSADEKAAMQKLMPQLMQMMQSGADPSTLLPPGMGMPQGMGAPPVGQQGTKSP